MGTEAPTTLAGFLRATERIVERVDRSFAEFDAEEPEHSDAIRTRIDLAIDEFTRLKQQLGAHQREVAEIERAISAVHADGTADRTHGRVDFESQYVDVVRAIDEAVQRLQSARLQLPHW
jgi:hypothetical protein